MFPRCRAVLSFPALLLLGLAGCTEDEVGDRRDADVSPDVAVEADAAKADVGPLFLDAKADLATAPDAGPKLDVAPLPRDARADSASMPDASPTPEAGVEATAAVDLAPADAAEVGIDGSSPLDTHVPIDGAMAADTRPACQMPSYSTNCIEVEYFQCGFNAKCEDGVISISWHEHACDGSSWVKSYSCTYTCPKGCNPNGIPWVSPGSQLIAQACNP